MIINTCKNSDSVAKMLLEMGQEVSNWASYYICFSKAALFISGNFSRFSSFAKMS